MPKPQQTIKQCLFDFLRSLPEVNALTGGRIFNVTRPRNSTLPALSYRRISGRDRVPPRQMSLGGQHGITKALFELMCWGANPDQADALAAAVQGEDILGEDGEETGLVTGIDGFQGRMGGPAGIGLCVTLAMIEDWEDVVIDPQDGSDNLFYAVRMEVCISFEEAQS